MGSASVTIYRLAIAIPSKAHAIVNSVAQVMFPFSSAVRDRLRLRRVYLKMLMGSGVVALGTLLPLAVFAKPILSFWVGSELAIEVAPILPIFALAYFFLSLSPAPHHVVAGIGKPWINTFSDAFNALANLALIGLLTRNDISLTQFAWAFAIANIINSVFYQAVVEFLVWRRGVLYAGRTS